MNHTNSIVFIRRPRALPWLWLAWYPLRGRRCSFKAERRTRPAEPDRDGWHVGVGVGPLWLGLGPGAPNA